MEIRAKNIAIFISGAGSNARNIVQFFKNDHQVQVKLIVSSNPNSIYFKQVENEYSTYLLNNSNELAQKSFLDVLHTQEIDLIVLAGFLWKIPKEFIQFYPDKILNIHPSLLPKFGGKGMYGRHVHKAVIDQKELESGITIHFVNQEYDKGAIVFQKKVVVKEYDSVSSLEMKIHKLEYSHYPEVIKEVLDNL